jgi:hypothetical protein
VTWYPLVIISEGPTRLSGHKPGCGCAVVDRAADIAHEVGTSSLQDLNARYAEMLGISDASPLDVVLAPCAQGYLPLSGPPKPTWEEKDASLVGRAADELRELATEASERAESAWQAVKVGRGEGPGHPLGVQPYALRASQVAVRVDWLWMQVREVANRRRALSTGRTPQQVQAVRDAQWVAAAEQIETQVRAVLTEDALSGATLLDLAWSDMLNEGSRMFRRQALTALGPLHAHRDRRLR